MGKRKRRADHKKLLVSSLSSDVMPCSLGMDFSSQEKSSPVFSSVNSGAVRPLPSFMDTTANSVKLLNTHPSLAHCHYNPSRSMFLKRSHHHYGHHYSRRASGSHADTLRSLCNSAASLCDQRIPFKLANRFNTEFGYHAESRGNAFHRPERIRSSPLVLDAVSPDVVKMVCGICLKLLRRKPCSLGNTVSSIVAVLVCGHVYHADCLEQKTSEEDRRDPRCPLCVESVDLPLNVDA